MTDISVHETGHGSAAAVTSVKVWDPVVRLFHWGLVAAFAVAWFSSEEAQPVHEFAGYTVAGLIAVRLLWGFAGGRYARFTQFLRGPSATVGYLADIAQGKERRYLGHNPAGAVMIVALLLTLAGTAFTGWLMAEPGRAAMLPLMPQVISTAFADEAGEAEGPVKELHEALANLLLLLAALHVGGVALASVRHRENLARAMVTGLKRAPAAGDVA